MESAAPLLHSLHSVSAEKSPVRDVVTPSDSAFERNYGRRTTEDGGRKTGAEKTCTLCTDLQPWPWTLTLSLPHAIQHTPYSIHNTMNARFLQLTHRALCTSHNSHNSFAKMCASSSSFNTRSLSTNANTDSNATAATPIPKIFGFEPTVPVDIASAMSLDTANNKELVRYKISAAISEHQMHRSDTGSASAQSKCSGSVVGVWVCGCVGVCPYAMLCVVCL
jgi:hypothetical protein